MYIVFTVTGSVLVSEIILVLLWRSQEQVSSVS